MKLLQHAFAPLWPHFGTRISTFPTQSSYPHKTIHAELKVIRKQVELILPGLRRIRQVSDFKTERPTWKMLCDLLVKVLYDMPQSLGAPPTLDGMQWLISETAKPLDEITREIQRIEAEDYFGYTPAMLDIQEIVGLPHTALEEHLPGDIEPPGKHLRIERAEYGAILALSSIRKAYPMLGGGCGLTPETAIILPKEIPNYVSMSHKIFSHVFHVKPISQALMPSKTRTYDVLQGKSLHRYPLVLWFDITAHLPFL